MKAVGLGSLKKPGKRGPAPVIIPVLGIDIFVIKVLRRHMLVGCDITRKIPVDPLMRTDQLIILVADPDL